MDMDKAERVIRNKEDYDNYYITTKNRLLEVIARETDKTRAEAKEAAPGTYEKQYLETLATQLGSFYSFIEDSFLFEKLDDWWTYVICIGCTGISLYIYHLVYAELRPADDSDVLFDEIDIEQAKYKLIEMKCGWYTPQEFAEAHGCAVSTVNVWIRRGKIRSAAKFGNKWMIPVLTLPLRRKYIEAVYTWDTRLFDFPEGFGNLEMQGSLRIRKTYRRKDMYYVEIEGSEREPYELSKLDVARLETYLIANPQVMYAGDDKYIDH